MSSVLSEKLGIAHGAEGIGLKKLDIIRTLCDMRFALCHLETKHKIEHSISHLGYLELARTTCE